MRALVKTAPGTGMELRDVPVPACGPNDVLIRVHHAGVCGTDLHIWEWDAWASNRLKPPVVIGHEFAGRIERLGPEAEAAGLLSVGDLVTAEGHIICGHCLQCRTGNGHLCQRTQIIGVDRDGAFADYIAMPASNVMKLEGIPTEIGAIMDPMGNAFHTVLEGDAVIGSDGPGAGVRPDRMLRGGRRARGRRLARHRQRLQRQAARHRQQDGCARDAQPRPGRRARAGAGADAGRRGGPGVRDERPPGGPRAGLRGRAARRAGSTCSAPRARRPRWISRGTSSSRGSRCTA